MRRPWDDPTSPWRTLAECADYLRHADRKSARRYLARRGVPAIRRGRVLLYRRDQVEQAIAGPQIVRRRSA